MEIDIKKVMSLDLYKILDIEEDASDNDVSDVRTRATSVTKHRTGSKYIGLSGSWYLVKCVSVSKPTCKIRLGGVSVKTHFNPPHHGLITS